MIDAELALLREGWKAAEESVPPSLRRSLPYLNLVAYVRALEEKYGVPEAPPPRPADAPPIGAQVRILGPGPYRDLAGEYRGELDGTTPSVLVLEAFREDDSDPALKVYRPDFPKGFQIVPSSVEWKDGETLRVYPEEPR